MCYGDKLNEKVDRIPLSFIKPNVKKIQICKEMPLFSIIFVLKKYSNFHLKCYMYCILLF